MTMLEDIPDSVPASGVNIFIKLPDNACWDITDEDSGDEEQLTVNNLPPSQLRADAQSRYQSDDDSSTEDDNGCTQPSTSKKPPEKKMKIYTRKKSDLASSVDYLDDMDS